jgi:hypothetical protein
MSQNCHQFQGICHRCTLISSVGKRERLNQSSTDGVSGGGSAARDVQFGKNIAHVPVHSTGTDYERFRYFAIGVA